MSNSSLGAGPLLTHSPGQAHIQENRNPHLRGKVWAV